MSDWHDELEFVLLPLEDLRIDSDCMTFVISNALSEHGIFHQCRIGYAEDQLSRMTTSPHCWIELEQGWCIDLTLREWLGDEDDLPHGVFQLSDYPRVRWARAWRHCCSQSAIRLSAGAIPGHGVAGPTF